MNRWMGICLNKLVGGWINECVILYLSDLCELRSMAEWTEALEAATAEAMKSPLPLEVFKVCLCVCFNCVLSLLEHPKIKIQIFNFGTQSYLKSHWCLCVSRRNAHLRFASPNLNSTLWSIVSFYYRYLSSKYQLFSLTNVFFFCFIILLLTCTVKKKP